MMKFSRGNYSCFEKPNSDLIFIAKIEKKRTSRKKKWTMKSSHTNAIEALPSIVSTIVNCCQSILRDTIPNATLRTYQQIVISILQTGYISIWVYFRTKSTSVFYQKKKIQIIFKIKIKTVDQLSYLIKHKTDEPQRKHECKNNFSHWNSKICQREHKPPQGKCKFFRGCGCLAKARTLENLSQKMSPSFQNNQKLVFNLNTYICIW